VDQEKIDIVHATPVPGPGIAPAAKPKRRGAPMWLQLLLSLIVIVAAVGVAALYNTTANTMLGNVGVKLPLLSDQVNDNPPSTQPTTQASTQPSQQQAAPGQGGGQRQGGGQGGGRAGGAGGFNRTAVVVTAAATTGIINNKLTSIGEGVAIQSVTVNTAQSGTLMTIDVKPGDKVVAGQRLATLDSDDQQNAYDKANLAAQDADATLARTQQLAKSNSASDVQVAAAQLAANQAKLVLTSAKHDLDQRTITTPVAGTVGIIQLTPGNLINAQTVVTTVEDSSSILVNFYVPERYSSQMTLGEAVTAESAALPGKSFTGKITAIDNKIDPDSRTLQVQATLPNPDGTIKSGMSFSVDMAFPGETFTSVDPLSIQWSTNGAYVWKVVDSKAKKGMVNIIQRNSDGVLVQGDVQPGDAVVTQGVLQLTDNAAVRLLDNGTTTPAVNSGGQGQASAQPPSQGQDGGASASAPQGQGEHKRKQGQSSEAASSAQAG
jgi:RND family efflux transporter MFP subunit